MVEMHAGFPSASATDLLLTFEKCSNILKEYLISENKSQKL
jgi:hypothetical protein